MFCEWSCACPLDVALGASHVFVQARTVGLQNARRWRIFRNEFANAVFGPEMDRSACPQPGNQFTVVYGALAEICRAHAGVSKERFNLVEDGMMRFHGPIISAIADTSTIINRGRANKLKLSHVLRMENDDWRKRFEEAAAKDGRSLRDISLAAGLSHGYLHGILRDGKEPTLDRFKKICKALKMSTAYALMGIEVTDDHVALIEEIDRGGPRADAILSLLRDK